GNNGLQVTASLDGDEDPFEGGLEEDEGAGSASEVQGTTWTWSTSGGLSSSRGILNFFKGTREGLLGFVDGHSPAKGRAGGKGEEAGAPEYYVPLPQDGNTERRNSDGGSLSEWGRLSPQQCLSGGGEKQVTSASTQGELNDSTAAGSRTEVGAVESRPSIDPFEHELEIIASGYNSLLSTELGDVGLGAGITNTGTLPPPTHGAWGGTSGHHLGSAAAEAAMALSIDEVLPSGLVDYFLVVGPSLDENGQLQVADYADCGFGSSGAATSSGQNGTLLGGIGPVSEVELECCVLEHFPEEQRGDAPFPTKVEWFCFPQGVYLVDSPTQPSPHVSSFVRFTAGVRSYGLCLTFYRPAGVRGEVNGMPGRGKVGSGERGRGEGGGGGGGGNGDGRLWCPVCLCALTHIPVLEGLVQWLKVFYWCL
ncbi:unnamed protein product, partial [Choristocarpus tenellus]